MIRPFPHQTAPFPRIVLLPLPFFVPSPTTPFEQTANGILGLMVQRVYKQIEPFSIKEFEEKFPLLFDLFVSYEILLGFLFFAESRFPGTEDMLKKTALSREGEHLKKLSASDQKVLLETFGFYELAFPLYFRSVDEFQTTFLESFPNENLTPNKANFLATAILLHINDKISLSEDILRYFLYQGREFAQAFEKEVRQTRRRLLNHVSHPKANLEKVKGWKPSSRPTLDSLEEIEKEEHAVFEGLRSARQQANAFLDGEEG